MLFAFRIDICIKSTVMRYMIYHDIHNVLRFDLKGNIQESNVVKNNINVNRIVLNPLTPNIEQIFPNPNAQFSSAKPKKIA